MIRRFCSEPWTTRLWNLACRLKRCVRCLGVYGCPEPQHTWSSCTEQSFQMLLRTAISGAPQNGGLKSKVSALKAYAFSHFQALVLLCSKNRVLNFCTYSLPGMVLVPDILGVPGDEAASLRPLLPHPSLNTACLHADVGPRQHHHMGYSQHHEWWG